MDIFSIKRKYNHILSGILNEDLGEKPLYHYTDLKGVLGILNSKNFRMTDAKYLNDTTEIIHGMESVYSFLEKYLPNNMSEELEVFWKTVLKLLQTSHEKYNVFVASFSLEEDLYTNWNPHSANAKGFCLGMSKNFFLRKLKNIEEHKLPLVFGSVFYTSRRILNIDIKNRLEKIINETNNFIISFYGKFDTKAKILRFYTAISTCLTIRLLSEICCIKHRGFRDQKEFRMAAAYIEGTIPKPEIKASTKPYIESPQFNKKDLIEIWSGPCANVNEIEKVRTALKEYEDISIIPSEIPLKVTT